MKNVIAAACLLAGIISMAISFAWDRILEPPLTEADMVVYQRAANIREHIALQAADESERAAADQIAQQMSEKVRRREQRKENGEFILTTVGVVLSFIGIAIVISTKANRLE